VKFYAVAGMFNRSTEPQVGNDEAVTCDGKPFTRALRGEEARLFQHEYDYLNGIVYVDRLADNARERLQPHLDKLVEHYMRES